MSGHGHVVPNADGTLARCGGPRLCSVCQAELAELQASARRAPAKVRDQLRLMCHEIHAAPANFREHQAIAIMLGGIAEIDRLQERVAELEAALADAVHRNRANPEI
jgi:hypothetical protein